jgi:hypothetical protein
MTVIVAYYRQKALESNLNCCPEVWSYWIMYRYGVIDLHKYDLNELHIIYLFLLIN